jgi:LPS-assembly protein
MEVRIIKARVKIVLAFFLLFTIHFLLFTLSVSAENDINISADKIEYIAESNTYIARGTVKIHFEDSRLSADEIKFNGDTYDALASGNVTYSDAEAEITAKWIELNLKTKTGTIYDCYIFYKNENYHVQSEEIRKTGDKNFTLDKAIITTCNADPPEWHIYSEDISITQHEMITGHHGRFNVMNIPLLYTPYFYAPLTRERESGFLLPSFGYSSERGYYYKQGFFWAIKDNQDATFYLDYYDKKGLAEGVDYRYILNPDVNGEFWMYHVRDDEPKRDLFEFKAYHNQALPYNIFGYLKLHAVNEFDYYDVMESTSANRIGLDSWKYDHFGFASEERWQKYLETNLQLSRDFHGGRTYLLSQARQSLERSSKEIPQTLPEVALIINTLSKGPFSFNMLVKGAHFWREEGQDGMRFDINPNLYFSYGRLLNITQKIGLRETAYFLNDPSETEERFTYDLSTTLTSRFFKRYSSIVHLIEPRVDYQYIPRVERETSIFDSTNAIPETSLMRYSFINTLAGFDHSSINGKFTLSQSYDFLDKDKPFSLIRLEGVLSSKNVNLSINASYDIDDKTVTDGFASINVRNEVGHIGLGQNFRRSSDLDQITAGAGLFSPIKLYKITLPLSLNGQIWYDLNTNQTQRLRISSTYSSQCWGVSVSYIERPDEYLLGFSIQLKGLGAIRFGSEKAPFTYSDPSGESFQINPYIEEGGGSFME